MIIAVKESFINKQHRPTCPTISKNQRSLFGLMNSLSGCALLSDRGARYTYKLTQPTFACSNSAMEIPLQYVTYVQR